VWRFIIKILLTSGAALAEDVGVGVYDENEFDEQMKADQRRHDNHHPVVETEVPQAKEHCRCCDTKINHYGTQ